MPVFDQGHDTDILTRETMILIQDWCHG